MKIVHICSVAYIDGWGYQDNLLPEYMMKAGHDVVVISSANHFPSFLKEEEKQKIINNGTEYYYEGVHIYRNRTELTSSNYTFVWHGLSNVLNIEQPDVIYHHGINSSSMLCCWRYVRKHEKCRLFIDSHADHINESPNKIWNLFIRILMKSCVRIVQNQVTKFYGVTPGRCEYLADVYGAPRSKIDLYPLGFDSYSINSITESKESLRKKYKINPDSFVVLSGGKMGEDKGTLSLIHAVNDVKKLNKDVKLLLFGRFTDSQTDKLANSNDYTYIQGWCDRRKTLELIKLSDVACWPVHHTTLIEDAVGSGIPIVIRKTPNTSHLIDGNGVFVIQGSEEELCESISHIIDNYSEFETNAKTFCNKFDYRILVEKFEKDVKC